MKEVLIATKLDGIAKRELEQCGSYDVICDETTGLEGLAQQHPDVYALLVRSEPVPAEIIDAFPRLRVIVRAGAGYNTIDISHARKRGIDVMNTPGANSNAVAEEVIALMLADARHIIDADRSTRQGKWEKKQFMGRELANKTVGILGLGNIGRLLARRLSGFDVELLGYDPLVPSERAREFGVEWTDLETLFAKCDYITLHMPENKATKGLVSENLLSKMKKGASLVNCARAGIVDLEALARLKGEKQLRYLNDVYEKDGAGNEGMAEVADIMMPHLGASTIEANRNAARQAAEQLIALDQRGVTSFIVNREIPDGLDRTFCELANTLARMGRAMVGPESALKQIETSFYGALEPYADWLLVPLVAGLWQDFEPSMDYRAAKEFLDSRGIEYVNRKIDQEKGYSSSISLDLVTELDADALRHISMRGTVAEGNLMVSRINEFDKLYFEPAGDMIMFLYDDRPGVIATVGSKLAGASINIEDVRNPHHSGTNRSLVIMKINATPDPALVQEISQAVDAISAFSFKI
jgi:D-3-phosphoglycerate dehydrogenase